MTVAENVQMALLSHRNRLWSLWPAATRLYREEALALLGDKPDPRKFDPARLVPVYIKTQDSPE